MLEFRVKPRLRRHPADLILALRCMSWHRSHGRGTEDLEVLGPYYREDVTC